MSDKDAAKRRRQARNRQERTTRQKRIAGAQRAATSRAGSEEGPAARPSRGQPSRTRASSVPAAVPDVGGVRGVLLRLTAQPGGRAAVLALLVSVVCAVMLLTFKVTPLSVLDGYGELVLRSVTPAAEWEDRLEAFRDAKPVLEMDYLIRVEGIAVSVLTALVPIVIAATAVSSLTKPTRSRTLLFSALAGALYVSFATRGLGFYFLVGTLALGFAAFQSRKADARAALAAAPVATDGA